ncbi:MAG TPA: hypothetical protein VND87_04495 [Stellaceae bacterium]|nr:hypothetical protein [Stellaceae bacterium]
MHPIVDKAEVAIDFPDKYYSGGFGRDLSFEARAEDDGMLIRPDAALPDNALNGSSEPGSSPLPALGG